MFPVKHTRSFALASVLLSTIAVLAQAGPQTATQTATQTGTQTAAQKAPAHLAIDPAHIIAPISPLFYGLMTEEINHAYQGGLYAELINNGTFHGNWMGVESWGDLVSAGAHATTSIDKADGPSAALPTSLKLVVDAMPANGYAGVTNAGYWGIALAPHTSYRGSFYARLDGPATAPVRIQLVNDDTAAVVGSATVTLASTQWKRYEFTIATATLASGDITAPTHHHIEYTLSQPATVHLQLASLMPPTFNNRPNGNRADLMERMAAMHPRFLRLPGGNYLEGDRLEDRYDFKKTIGPLVDRPGHMAPWTYWSADGLGLLEFLEWTEDLHIEPVLAVYAGYALQGAHVATGKDLQPYVQDALDEVEYVTGDVHTRWGAERAKDGHPAPFPLHYIEIGNEDEFDKSGSYDARFAQFSLALRAKYPQYKLIATAPVKETAGAVPDLLDDHYYKSPADMFALVHHYDEAPRTGPKVFVGEWATRSGSPTPNFGDTLGDAAWMTAMERNSDLIVMASYAPLLVNVEPGAMQWPTDLIGYNGATTYGSPSYYAQSLFAGHLGDSLPQNALRGAPDRFFSSATLSAADRVLHIKLVNATPTPQALSIDVAGLSSGTHRATVNTLHAATFEATNSLARPTFIVPHESTVSVSGPRWQHTVPALTIEVIDLPLK